LSLTPFTPEPHLPRLKLTLGLTPKLRDTLIHSASAQNNSKLFTPHKIEIKIMTIKRY